jgi:hypothetical protein
MGMTTKPRSILPGTHTSSSEQENIIGTPNSSENAIKRSRNGYFAIALKSAGQGSRWPAARPAGAADHRASAT